MRALCARAAEEADSPSAVRGCVQTKQLARDLPFQSKYANEENVRQVVRRLRGVLGEIGVETVLAVAPGRGYYLSCPVVASRANAASSDRRRSSASRSGVSSRGLRARRRSSSRAIASIATTATTSARMTSTTVSMPWV